MMAGSPGNGYQGPSDPFGSRRRLQGVSKPGSYRRSFLWGFWSIILIAVITLVDVVMRQAWVSLLTPVLLLGAAWTLSRSHEHQKAVAALPPADGEDSFRRRLAARHVHDRAELAWGLTTLALLMAALLAPALLA